MKKLIFSALALSLLAVACKKDETPEVNQTPLPANPQSINYFPLDSGSYWVYETWRIDSLNNETYVSTDTVWAVGDTVIAGQTYTELRRRDNQFSIPGGFYRDSANCIVSPGGKIMLSLTMPGQQLNIDSIWSGNVLMLVMKDTMNAGTYSVTVNSVNYTTYQRSTFVDYYLSSPSQPHAPYRNNFAQGVGLVRSQYIFASNPGNLFERRLVSYHIE